MKSRNTRPSYKQFGYTALAAALLSTMAVGAQVVSFNPVTDVDILNDQATTKDVVSYGLGPKAEHFSPQKTLDKSNIQELRPVWASSTARRTASPLVKLAKPGLATCGSRAAVRPETAAPATRKPA